MPWPVHAATLPCGSGLMIAPVPAGASPFSDWSMRWLGRGGPPVGVSEFHFASIESEGKEFRFLCDGRRPILTPGRWQFPAT